MNLFDSEAVMAVRQWARRIYFDSQFDSGQAMYDWCVAVAAAYEAGVLDEQLPTYPRKRQSTALIRIATIKQIVDRTNSSGRSAA